MEETGLARKQVPGAGNAYQSLPGYPPEMSKLSFKREQGFLLTFSVPPSFSLLPFLSPLE